MSLPLTRRIAKTVLLTAAGAASVVGTAGAASAAELPSTADVGGLSTLDDGLSNQVGQAASEGARSLTPMSSTSPLSAPNVPDAGVSANTNNHGTVRDTADVAADTVSGAGNGMQEAPKLERHLPEVHTMGLPTDDTPQTKPGQAPVQNPAPQNPSAQDPAQNPSAQAPAQKPAQKPAQQDPAAQDLVGRAAGQLGLSPQNLPTKGLLPKGVNVGPLGG